MADHEQVCVLCVCFTDRPHRVLFGFHPNCQCVSAMLYSVENQVRRHGSRVYFSSFIPGHTHPCSYNTIFSPYSVHVFLSIGEVPQPRSAAVFRVMCYRLMLFTISLCRFSSTAERMQAETHHFSFHGCSKLLHLYMTSHCCFSEIRVVICFSLCALLMPPGSIQASSTRGI